MVSIGRLRRYRLVTLTFVLMSAFWWSSGCGDDEILDGDDGDGEEQTITQTYQLTLTGISATGETTGQSVSFPGLPVTGTEISVTGTP